MSHDLHDRFEDLVADAPTYVVPDARAAWAAGARRRVRHRAAVGAAVVAVIALAAGAVAWLPSTLNPAPADSGDGGVDRYPARVGYPHWSSSLDEVPEGVAGILDRVDERETHDEPIGWYAVGETGRLWEISHASAYYQPALSPDGMQLAYLDTGAGQSFTILHLADGSATSVSIVGESPDENEGNRGGSYELSSQMPSYWSPDSRRLLVQVGEQGETVLVGVDGEMTPVRTGIPAWSAGWVDDETLAWMLLEGDRSATVVLTDLDGDPVGNVSLELPGDRSYGGQWFASVSADGSRIAVTDDEIDADVRIYSLASGKQVGPPVASDIADVCTMSWAGSSLHVPTQGDDGVLLTDDSGNPRVMADPRLGARCSQWASDALAGERHGGVGDLVFGSSNSWLSWHWQEVVLVVLGVLALGAAVVIVVRRSGAGGPTT